MLQTKNYSELFKLIEVDNLYINLIEQLNKDFQLANLNESYKITISPTKLKAILSSFLLDLITNNYDDYLNFLYRVDVSENELLKIKSDNLNDTIEQITYLILKREYQKVWLKNNFGKHK